MLLKPQRLLPGDLVGLVMPSSPPKERDFFTQTVKGLKAHGFKVQLGRNARKRDRYFAGTDRERAADLMAMFKNRSVKAIFCGRGGYGSGRLLSLLDYNIIKKNPKIFVGFSDITALHCAIYQKTGLVTFHGPTAGIAFGRNPQPEFAFKKLMATLSVAKPLGSICTGYPMKRSIDVLRSGIATGPLIGGNLSVLTTLIGTPFEPKLRGKILFLEDIDEPPYRIDRYLTHLLNSGLLKGVLGIACGGFTSPSRYTPTEKRRYPKQIREVLADQLLQLKVPIVTGLPFGHIKHNATLPFGIGAKLDARKGDLEILSAAIR